MANPVKGEVDFEAEGQKYRFVFGMYARSALEDHFGDGISDFYRKPVEKWGAGDLIAVFWAGLLLHHDVSRREASRLIDLLGDKAGSIVVEAVIASNPEVADTGTERPTKARGQRSKTY